MNLSGIKKLRIAVTLLLLIAILGILLSFLATDEDTKIQEQFYGKLTGDEKNNLSNIFEKYPSTSNYDMMVSEIGWIYWILLGGLFILTIKVWEVEDISSFKETKYVEYQQSGYNQSLLTVCWNCQSQYNFVPNVSGTTNVQCPYCGAKAIIGDKK